MHSQRCGSVTATVPSLLIIFHINSVPTEHCLSLLPARDYYFTFCPCFSHSRYLLLVESYTISFTWGTDILEHRLAKTPQREEWRHGYVGYRFLRSKGNAEKENHKAAWTGPVPHSPPPQPGRGCALLRVAHQVCLTVQRAVASEGGLELLNLQNFPSCDCINSAKPSENPAVPEACLQDGNPARHRHPSWPERAMVKASM